MHMLSSLVYLLISVLLSSSYVCPQTLLLDRDINILECSARCKLSQNCTNWQFAANSCYWNAEAEPITEQYATMLHGKKEAVPNPLHFFVSRPVLLLPSTTISHEADFYAGCSYTLSMWIYIFEDDLSSKYYSLFSTRSSRHHDEYVSLTPTIVTNLQPHPKKLFFSVMHDNHTNLEGFWSTDEIVYDTWMHVAMVIDGDKLRGYIDGKLQKQVSLYLSGSSCYYHNIHDDIRNNSYVQVGSRAGSKTMRGMVQKMIYMRHIALSTAEIQHLMQIPPLRFPTFTRLLSMRYLVEDGYCPIMEHWESNDYFLVSIGLCPSSVCGGSSIVEFMPQNRFDEVNLIQLLQQVAEFTPADFIDSMNVTIAVMKRHRNIVQSHYFRSIVNATLNSHKLHYDTNIFMGDINEADYFLYPNKMFPEDAHSTAIGENADMNHGIWNSILSSVESFFGLSTSDSSGIVGESDSSEIDEDVDVELDAIDTEAMVMMHDIQYLYSTAMAIRRHDDNSFEWENSAAEKAISMLHMALILCDELETTHPVFNFLNQPIRLALSYYLSDDYMNQLHTRENMTAFLAEYFYPTLPSVDIDDSSNGYCFAATSTVGICPLPAHASPYSSHSQINVERTKGEVSADAYDFDNKNDCVVATSYLSSVSQYVASNFGVVTSGVTTPEDTMLADMTLGTDPAILATMYFEGEAAAGDGNAMVQMGVRHFWGERNVPPNPVLAREWFQRAADVGNAEGMFNIGVMHENGQGGLPPNITKALEYYQKAANNTKPHAAALHALGNYYRQTNISLARQYYEKSASIASALGYFSYGSMVLHGFGDEQDVPLGIYLIAKAASTGHIHSLNALAHLLIEPTSLVAKYARRNISSLYTLNVTREKQYKKWNFNSSMPISLTLDGVNYKLPQPLQLDCHVSAAIMKYLAAHSYRPNDLMRDALEAYKKNDFVQSLELYSEAADLGSMIAQENVAYIYDELIDRYCTERSSWHDWTSSVVWSISRINDTKLDIIDCYHLLQERHRRWVQIANTGNAAAILRLGRSYSKPQSSYYNPVLAADVFTYAAKHLRDAESFVNLAFILRNESNAYNSRKLLFAALEYDLHAQQSTGGLGPVVAIISTYLSDVRVYSSRMSDDPLIAWLAGVSVICIVMLRYRQRLGVMLLGGQ